MATEANVERLFNLPCSKGIMNGIVEPFVISLTDVKCAYEGVNPELIVKVYSVARKNSFLILQGTIFNYFVNNFSDEEIGFFYKLCQNPTFLKLHNKAPDIQDILMALVNTNKIRMDCAIKGTLCKAVAKPTNLVTDPISDEVAA